MLVLSSTSLAFGAQAVGTTSAPQKVVVSNTGTSTLRITSLAVSGSSFAVSSSAPFDLVPGANKELTVTFNPTAAGAFTGTLTLASNDPAWLNATVTLSGNGGGVLALSPVGVLDFGSVRVGTSSSRSVTLTNTSSAPVTLQYFSGVTAPFSVTGLELPRTLPANSSITFTVAFSPTVSAVVNGRVTVVSDALNGPHELMLQGTGATPVAELSLPSHPGQTVLDFGEVRVNSSKVELVRLTNKGNAPLNFTKAVVSAGSPFSYLGPSTLTVAPGAYVEFQVSFKPTASVVSNDTLVIESDATNSPSLLSLMGRGTSSEASLDRNSLVLRGRAGGGRSARQSVLIRNTGTAELIVQSLSVVGPFSATSDVPLPVEVPAGGSTSFSVGFKPTAHGLATGSVSILTDANVGAR